MSWIGFFSHFMGSPMPEPEPKSTESLLNERQKRYNDLQEKLGISFYDSPWVPGTRAAAYFGPVRYSIIVDYGEAVSIGMWDALEYMMRRAHDMGGNSVVGLERSLIMLSCGDHVKIDCVGTAARLEALV